MRSSEAMELLGFPPYSRPSPSEVKAASRRMVVESHPDRVPTHQKSQAESKFKQISEAYSCLKDGVGWKQFPLVPSALQEHTSGKRRSVPPRTLFFHGGRSL